MLDKLIMDNYLLVLKSTIEVYIHGTLEASNTLIKQTLKSCLDDILNCQEKTYNEMTKYGWYTVNNIEKTKIKETLNKLNNN